MKHFIDNLIIYFSRPKDPVDVARKIVLLARKDIIDNFASEFVYNETGIGKMNFEAQQELMHLLHLNSICFCVVTLRELAQKTEIPGLAQFYAEIALEAKSFYVNDLRKKQVDSFTIDFWQKSIDETMQSYEKISNDCQKKFTAQRENGEDQWITAFSFVAITTIRNKLAKPEDSLYGSMNELAIQIKNTIFKSLSYSGLW